MTGYLVLQTVLFITITSIALVGNVLVLLAIYRNPSLRSTTHVFIGALAVTDLLSACIVQPLTSTVLLTGSWNHGEGSCFVHGFTGTFLTYTSSHIMLLTAINRYYRVIRPNACKRLFTRKRVLFLLLALPVLVACVVLVPYFSGWANFTFTGVFPACILTFASEGATRDWAVFEFCLFSLFPMIVITICYCKVSKKVRQHNQMLGHRMSNGGASLSVEEINITKTLFALVFAFFGCIFTGFVLIVVCRVIAGAVLQPIGTTVAFLVSIASAINPILYASTCKRFHREFQQILRCKTGRNEVFPSIAGQSLHELGPNTTTRTVERNSPAEQNEISIA